MLPDLLLGARQQRDSLATSARPVTADEAGYGNIQLTLPAAFQFMLGYRTVRVAT